MQFDVRSVTIAMLCWILFPVINVEAQDLNGFIRGDINGDLSNDLSDPILLLEELFGSAPGLNCAEAADLNDDGQLLLDDVILSLGHIFLANPAQLPGPYPDCGTDPQPPLLACDNPPCLIGPILGKRELTLASIRRLLPYEDQLPQFLWEPIDWQLSNFSGVIRPGVPFVSYGIVPGELLPGNLTLDHQTGQLSGSAIPPGQHSFRLWGLASDGSVMIFNSRLAAFSSAESVIVPGQTLFLPGPYLSQINNGLLEFTHQLPWPTPYPLWSCTPTEPPSPIISDFKVLRIFLPTGVTESAPVVIFHHGTGFDWEQYDSLLGFISTHGVICVSVNNPFSFDVYPDWYCWGGHDEAGKVMVRVREVIEELAATPGHAMEGRVDSDRIFYAGHSRGASSAIVAAELDPDVRGLILLQPTDAKQDSWIGNTTRWQKLPDIPLISITAEQDTDVIYPYAERLHERMSGPSTSVCIYGGCHGFSSDNQIIGCGTCDWTPTSPQVDSCSYISRTLQHQISRQWMWTFLRRHAYDDLSVEGLLYGSESQFSPYYSVVHHRNLSGAIVVDDFEQFPVNRLGELVTSTNTVLFLQGACYDWPFPVPQPIPSITNLVTILPSAGTSTISMPLGTTATPLDIGPRKNLQFRFKNHDIHGALDNIGWHFNGSISLSDADGRTATLNLLDLFPTIAEHPQTTPATIAVQLKYQRFIQIAAPIDQFLAVEPLLDPSRLISLDWEFTTDGTAPFDVRFGLDDIIFE
ncbi:MAG: hypothetical protein AAEJ04_10505 [Planctomycetota bacterium]